MQNNSRRNTKSRRNNKNRMIISTSYSDILEYFNSKSSYLYDYINKNKDFKYQLIMKEFRHSDLISAGKRTDKKQGLEYELLDYMSKTLKNQINNNKEELDKYPTSHQSNINIHNNFFTFFNINKLERRIGKQTENHKHIAMHKISKVFIVTETLENFLYENTEKVFNILNKNDIYNKKKNKYFNKNINIDTKLDVLKIELNVAIHGLGTKDNLIFQEIRKGIFLGDYLNILQVITNKNKKIVFILLEKNPVYFTITKKSNLAWQEYLEKLQKDKKSQLKAGEDLTLDEKNRKLQTKWKDNLAREIMAFTANNNEIFCPLTMISADYNNLSTLFRASHIKPYSECDAKEAFDINNGLLLIANADALFDKFLISVNSKKELCHSFLLDQNKLLIQQLKLNQEIFTEILNDERMKYLSYHYEKFLQKERERKK